MARILSDALAHDVLLRTWEIAPHLARGELRELATALLGARARIAELERLVGVEQRQRLALQEALQALTEARDHKGTGNHLRGAILLVGAALAEETT
jgi:hypothetical protein